MELHEYDARVAGRYDSWQPPLHDYHPSIEMLIALASGGRALELGIGTGRVAVPLAARGVPVHGIDRSEAMVSVLRAKPGGAAIPVVIGDFANLPIAGEFALVYCVGHTLFCLPSQEDQVRCFDNVSRRLAPDGVFVLELFVPDAPGMERDDIVRTFFARPEGAMIGVSEHDRVRQVTFTQQILITPMGIELYPERLRYAWPAELDLMAQLAGLRLRHRWGGWRHEPFTGASATHVSV